MGAARARRLLLASLLSVLVVSAAPVEATPFCDCCCTAAAGNGGICAGCDLDDDGLVGAGELALLGCDDNPICAAFLPTPTATATRAPSCVGDCNADDAVTISELLTMVNIALGRAATSACAMGDGNGDGAITVPELIAAVGRALTGCTGSTPAATATRTETADTPSATTPTATTETPGAGTPTATATTAPPGATATATVAPIATATSSATRTATGTMPPTATATRSPIATLTGSATTTATALASVTATPTRTVTATVAVTPCAAVAESAAGGAVIIANGMGVIPSVVASIVSGIRFADGSLAAVSGQGGGGACPQGGTATRTGSFPGTMTITLDDCALATADGRLVADGTVTLSGVTLNANLQFTNTDPSGTTTRLTSTATLMGTVLPAFSANCFLNGGTFQLASGTLTSEVPGEGGVAVAFSNTSVGVAITHFTADCVPDDYTLTFNGPATLTRLGDPVDTSIPVGFTSFAVAQNATVVPAQTTMNGTVTASCFGGAVTIATLAPVTQAVGVLCPTGGALRVAASLTADVLYLADGAVGIDVNLDGVSDETIASCIHPRLTACQTQCAGPTPTPTATRTGGATATATASASTTATGTPTRTRTATVTVVPGATATATRSASPTRTATPLTETRYCSTSPALAIPDNDPTGVTGAISVPDDTVLGDLNVQVSLSHTYVGDLQLRLVHVETGTTVRLLDRPGDNDCNRDDVMAWFDDEAGREAQDLCFPLPPAIDGSAKPVDALGAVDGEPIGGTWQLTAADLAAQDLGTLGQWCLIVNSTAPVVTQFTCDGAIECTVEVGTVFNLAFSWFDPDSNVSAWHISGVRDDDLAFNVGGGLIDPPNGGGTLPVNIFPFICDGGNCRETRYDYRVVMTDSTGLASPPGRIHVRVPATGP